MYIKIENISKSYKYIKIIKDINIEIEKGEFVSLLGKSGVGKTTLFNILSGIEKPDSGKIFLEEKDITDTTTHFSYMQQKDLLLPFYTVFENIALPLKIKGIQKEEINSKINSYAKDFGLESSLDKFPNQISGGMKQRASLLRSFLFSEDLMLLDEPFSALDYFTKKSLYEWYNKMAKSKNATTFFITHDIDEALILSDKIYVMNQKPGIITKVIKIENKENNFELTNKFLNYKKDLLESLR